MNKQTNMDELHWMMDMLQSVDMGLVVLDKNYRVKLWNRFMANHSGVRPLQVADKDLFKQFPDLPEQWLKDKIDTVFLLQNRMYSNWEQRNRLFKFRSYRAITGQSKWMYQDVELFPLGSPSGGIEHICIAIYDVTDIALGKIDLQTANTELAHLSQTDRMTGLLNRGYWEEQLNREFQRQKRYTKPSTLAMFDIDHFKKVNDTYGHQAGDEVIRLLADTLRKNLRDTDLAGRYGGEEFAVILIDTPQDSARYFAERLRKSVEAMKVVVNGIEITFTISLGIAEATGATSSCEQWLSNADLALYHSKHNGRNQTALFDETLRDAD